MVSNCLHSFVDKKSLKKLALHEAKILLSLNESAIHKNTSLDRDEVIKTIINEVKEVEIRKKNILNDRKRTLDKTPPRNAQEHVPVTECALPEPTLQEKHFIGLQKNTICERAPRAAEDIQSDVDSVEAIEEQSKSLYQKNLDLINNLRADIDELKANKPVSKHEIEDIQAFNNALLAEIEDVSKKVAMTKGNFMIEMDSMRDTMLSLKNQFK